MTETPEQLRAYEPEAAAPLDGVRVLDLSRLLAGNILTHGLADFGAEVIKVERPGKGDDLRHWTVKGVPTYWKVFCRNKKSVTLDLRRDEGRDLLLGLVETAAVLVENFRPGTLEGWGLGPDDVLLRRNPRLVVVRISGWGQTGPFRHKPGYGSLVEAMSGYAARTGFPDGPPVLPPIALADSIAGYYGAMATLVALREAERSGRGQVLDLSLFEPIFSILGPEAANYRLTGRVPQRLGNRSVDTAPRNLYRCKDGRYVALSASMQGMAERVFRAIGRPELIDDPRFRTNADRVANSDALDAIVAAFMAGRTQAEAVAFFEAADVTVGPVSDIAELVAHPYVREREIVASYPDEDMGGALPMHGVPGRLSATPGRMRAPAPKLGEHTAALLGEIGVGATRRAELAAAGVI